MNSAVNFILESGVSLALLSLIYVLFLRKETFLRLNRIFLLISVFFSVLLPFLRLKVYAPQSVMLPEVTVTPYRNLIEAVTIYGKDFSGTVVQSVSSSNIIIFVYLTGLILFLGRLIFRLIQIAVLIRRNPVDVIDGVKFVSLSKDFSPFSFLNYVFVNPDKREELGYDKIIAHEMEHIRQGHTFDVLMLEVLTVIQWFNPFMWILKLIIRENHEYLADRAVLNQGVSPSKYKHLLLNQALGFQLKLTNNFNSSLIKKRIRMMSKIQSSKIANLKYVIGVISLVALVVVFACEKKDFDETKTIADLEKISLSIIDDKIKLEGAAKELNKLQKIMSESGFAFEVDDTGSLFMKKIKDEGPKWLAENEVVYTTAEVMPEFPGGDAALKKQIVGLVKYPEIAKENGVQGKVYVTFVVSKYGEVVNTKIARGIDPSIDAEAVRVINKLTKWKPGMYNGEAVNVKYTVPINFMLAPKNTNKSN